MIHLSFLNTYCGPNLYASDPVVVIRLVFAHHAPQSALEKFNAIRRAFPRWSSATLTEPGPDEFECGSQLASLAQWMLNDVRGLVHTAKCLKDESGFLLILGYHNADVSRLAARIAVSIFMETTNVVPERVTQKLSSFWSLCRQEHPDYQARILMQAARYKGVPVLHFVRRTKFWQYGWGSKSRVFFESLSNADGAISFSLSKNKAISKAFFSSLGVPTPASMLISGADDLDEAIEKIGYPCVIKPLDKGGGKGVTADIRNRAHLDRAIDMARKCASGPLLLEQFIPGDDHRLMVVDGKFIAAFRRRASSVVGDGVSTIRQLIESLNSQRSVNMLSSGYLRPIPLDAVLVNYLSDQEVHLDQVLPEGRKIFLRSNSNLSTGGEGLDMTAIVHPTIREMAVQMSESAGFGTAGFDYMTTDISQCPWESGSAFIEMNTTPGIDLAIASGWTAEAIGSLVLGPNVGRIPINLHLINRKSIGINGPLDRASFGEKVAVVHGNEIRVGEAIFRIQSEEPWAAVMSALRNKAIQSLQVFCHADQIISHGLPVDRFDKLVLNGVTLPAGWMDVLYKHASEIVETTV